MRATRLASALTAVMLGMQVTVHCILTFGMTLCVGVLVGNRASGQVVPDLQIHFTFDDQGNPELDSSGNDQHGEIVGAEWAKDPERGGVLEFLGSNDGFVRGEIAELPGDDFTITFWAYRDSLTAGQNPNDGLFQVQLGGDTPTGTPADKVIGGWVGQDRGVWGRIHQGNRTRVNLDPNAFFIDVDVWTHFAYRGDGTTFELLVDGEAGVGPSAPYDGTLDKHDTLFIGKQGGTESWGGRIDDFRVYSRALSDEQVGLIMSGDADIDLDSSFRRGDSNADGNLNLTDAVFTLNHLFLGGREPDCSDTADADDNGSLQITDAVYTLNFLFLGGRAPPAPGPAECGTDPTEDELGCEAPPASCQ